MSLRFRVRHETIYQYNSPVILAQNEARMQLRNCDWQETVSETVRLTPDAGDRSERIDYFGNRALYFSVQTPHSVFTISVESEIILYPERRPAPEQARLTRSELAGLLAGRDQAAREAMRWVWPSPRLPHMPHIEAWARDICAPHADLLAACKALMDHIYTNFRYDTRSTAADTPVGESFKKRAGVCQDFAHVMVCALRGLGIPARYVSGYLETRPPPGQTKLVGADASHAWVSVLFPGLGWIDFDPTNNCLPSDRHLTLAWGRDVSDVVPVKGVMVGGNQHQIGVKVDVNPIL